MSDAEPSGLSAPSMRRLRLAQISTVAIVIAAVAATLYLRDHLKQIEPYGYAAIFIIGLVSNATLILPVPGLAVTSAMGAVFNPILVGLVAGAGQAIGELTGYLAGYSGQRLIDASPRSQKLANWVRRYGALAIFILALVPNPLFDAGGLLAGAARMPVWQYLLATAAGKIIKNILFAYLGDWGGGVLAGM